MIELIHSLLVHFRSYFKRVFPFYVDSLLLFIPLWYFQVYVYNEEVVSNSIRPSLVDLFLEVASKIDDKVTGIERYSVTDRGHSQTIIPLHFV